MLGKERCTGSSPTWGRALVPPRNRQFLHCFPDLSLCSPLFVTPSRLSPLPAPSHLSTAWDPGGGSNARFKGCRSPRVTTSMSTRASRQATGAKPPVRDLGGSGISQAVERLLKEVSFLKCF